MNEFVITGLSPLGNKCYLYLSQSKSRTFCYHRVSISTLGKRVTNKNEIGRVVQKGIEAGFTFITVKESKATPLG